MSSGSGSPASNDANPYAPPTTTELRTTPTASGATFVQDGIGLDADRGVAWITEAWNLFRADPGTWIGIMLIFSAMSIAAAIVPGGSLATGLLSCVFSAGSLWGCADLEAGRSLRVNHLFKGFQQKTFELVTCSLIYLGATIGLVLTVALLGGMLYVAGTVLEVDLSTVGAEIWISLFVLVIVGLALPLYMAIWFAPALVVFHDMKPMDAMLMSFRACLKNMLPFLVYGIVFFVLLVLSIFTLGLAWFVLVPMYWISMYTSYKDVFIEAP